MGTAANAINSELLLKTIFGDSDPAWSAKKESRLLAEIPEDRTWGGDDNGHVIVVRYSAGAGVSADFVTAQATAKESAVARFTAPERRLYGIRYIDGSFKERTASNRHAYVRAVEDAIKMGRWEYNSVWAQQAWANAGGSLARIPSAQDLALTTITFADAHTASLFEIGREYQFASDDGTAVSPAGLRDVAKLTVTSVDIETYTVTFGDALNTIPAIAGNDYIHLAGNYGKAQDGILAWLPLDATGLGTPFHGVTRSVHPAKLAGYRYSGRGGRKTDAIRFALAECRNAGSKPTRVYVNPLTMAEIVSELQAFETAPLGGADPKLGHTGVVFRGTGSSVLLVEEDYAPVGYGIGLDPKDWRVWTSQSGMGHIDNADGIREMLRVANADAYEIRFKGYGPGICPKNDGNGPGNGLIITF